MRAMMLARMGADFFKCRMALRWLTALALGGYLFSQALPPSAQTRRVYHWGELKPRNGQPDEAGQQAAPGAGGKLRGDDARQPDAQPEQPAPLLAEREYAHINRGTATAPRPPVPAPRLASPAG